MFADNPLASGFNITAGSVNVVVPSVADGSDYIIARAYSVS